jgi:hypothetical protein
MSLSWKMARRVLEFKNSFYAADDWPKALRIEDVVVLQFPWGRSAEEKRTAGSQRIALSDYLKEWADNHPNERIIDERVKSHTVKHSTTQSNFVLDWLPGRDIVRRSAQIDKAQDITERHCLIPAESFAAILEQEGYAGSEHIKAWISSVVVTQQESVVGTEQTKAVILDALDSRYPYLRSAWIKGEKWLMDCRVSGKRGWYYREKVEAGCAAKWPPDVSFGVTPFSVYTSKRA